MAVVVESRGREEEEVAYVECPFPPSGEEERERKDKKPFLTIQYFKIILLSNS